MLKIKRCFFAVPCFLLIGLLFVEAQNSEPIQIDQFQNPIKLVCVGDSITKGYGIEKGQSWPDQIAKALGEKWIVCNCGYNGATLLNNGDKPYQKQKAFNKAKMFAPDVVVIILGTNDTRPPNWPFKDQFEADYIDLIKQFSELPSKPRIFICYPPYIAGDNAFGISENNTKAEIPMIDKIAKATNAGIIDVHAALEGKDAMIPDKVHPNADGAAEIAKAVYKGLTGKNYP